MCRALVKIGQFEAYFYASYIVADRVIVISKHDEDTAQYRPHNVVNEYLSHSEHISFYKYVNLSKFCENVSGAKNYDRTPLRRETVSKLS